ncbi:MAG: NAD-binding protein [Candidatus Margulisbacteria bacterium]|nr:NAD-binding protein [Candidatus Margulisiibacteriota bacterium]
MVSSLAVLRESKIDSKGREIENRVILTPALVKGLKAQCPGIKLYVEKNAGAKIDFPDAAYEAAGAVIASHDEALQADLILGVKETRLEDFPKLTENIFISFQHFAQSRERTELALRTKTAFIALETMEAEKSGHPFFPCLAPMSEAAAKVIARHADEFALLSKKIITSGLPETGLHGAKVAILGGGSVGRTAAEEFSERGCEVTLLEKNPDWLRSLAGYFKTNEIRFPKVTVREVSPENLRAAVRDSFFLVSSMYTAGRKPEKIVTVDLLRTMQPGGCVYPVDIDQGGGVEGVIETSILDPFDLPVIPGTEVFFFAPPNLPSMGARTSSEALGTVVLPHVVEIINKGLDKAAEENSVIASGINIRNGKIVHPGLASVFPRLAQ